MERSTSPAWQLIHLAWPVLVAQLEMMVIDLATVCIATAIRVTVHL